MNGEKIIAYSGPKKQQVNKQEQRAARRVLREANDKSRDFKGARIKKFSQIRDRDMRRAAPRDYQDEHDEHHKNLGEAYDDAYFDRDYDDYSSSHYECSYDYNAHMHYLKHAALTMGYTIHI